MKAGLYFNGSAINGVAKRGRELGPSSWNGGIAGAVCIRVDGILMESLGSRMMDERVKASKMQRLCTIDESMDSGPYYLLPFYFTNKCIHIR